MLQVDMHTSYFTLPCPEQAQMQEACSDWLKCQFASLLVYFIVEENSWCSMQLQYNDNVIVAGEIPVRKHARLGPNSNIWHFFIDILLSVVLTLIGDNWRVFFSSFASSYYSQILSSIPDNCHQGRVTFLCIYEFITRIKATLKEINILRNLTSVDYE